MIFVCSIEITEKNLHFDMFVRQICQSDCFMKIKSISRFVYFNSVNLHKIIVLFNHQNPLLTEQTFTSNYDDSFSGGLIKPENILT